MAKKVFDKALIKDLDGRRVRNKNFSGRVDEHNDKGQRLFSIELPTDIGEKMLNDGWPVNRRLYVDKDTNEDVPRYFMKVVLKYHIDEDQARRYDPIVHLVAEDGTESLLTQDDIAILDDEKTNIVRASLQLNPWNYNVRGREGVQAQLDVAYFYLGAPIDNAGERQDFIGG